MRKPAALLLALTLSGGAAAARAAPTDLAALEAAWHACVRDAYAHQPPGQSRAGDQRNALDECRAHEDRFVEAALRSRDARDEPLSARALAWAASVASAVWRPVSAWLDGPRR